MPARKYPVITETEVANWQPVSFVVVKFSGDYDHNIARSSCVHDPRNQLVTVDNRENLFFDNLSMAINEGIGQARHDLIVIVHEDVLLPDGWQERFLASLEKLEVADPDWGMLGAVGWTREGTIVGHFSDPHQYRNTFVGQSHVQVARLDEQMLVIRKSSGLRFDPLLPSIHNIGSDIAETLRRDGRHCYAIDAPTIHKYADADGRLIENADQSPKIRARLRHDFAA